MFLRDILHAELNEVDLIDSLFQDFILLKWNMQDKMTLKQSVT